MVKFIVVHRNDQNNVGDIASNPLQYFLSPSEYQVVDITKLQRTRYPANVPIIVGGGGLLANDFFGDAVKATLGSSDKDQLLNLWNQRWVPENPAYSDLAAEFSKKYHGLIHEYISQLTVDRAPRIIWGAGHNGDFPKKVRGFLQYPDWLTEFALLGIRDWNQNVPWAPCASCMHPALRKTYPIKNDIIWFEHKKQMIKDFGSDSIPRFVNSGSNVEQTIELLGSANIIVTNSYHGAYWGTLLKKRVVVVGPWSSKFYSMRHMPVLVDKADQWREAVEQAEIYNTALDDCTSATLSFWKEVQART